MVKESIKIPNKRAAITAFKGRFLSENGNNKMTGQHGVIPLILSQSGEIIIKAGKQIIVENIINFLFFLAIIFQNLNPINRLG